MIVEVRTEPIFLFYVSGGDARLAREASGAWAEKITKRPGFVTASFGHDGHMWDTAAEFEKDWETNHPYRDGLSGKWKRGNPEPEPARDVYVATLEGSRFLFTATDLTHDLAIAALEETWKRHARQNGYAVAASWEEVREDINVRRFVMGHGYRDGTLFHEQLHPVPDHDHDSETDF